MKQVLQRIGILFVIFIAAGIGYFYWMQNRTMREATVYSTMEEAHLPVVYMEALGREMNCLYGYVQEMSGAMPRGSLTVLSGDRLLPIRIRRCDGQVTGIYYEVRSLDLNSLIERTSVKDWETGADGTKALLPIQNLLTENQEYLLTLTVDTDMHGAVRYYTRIKWTDNTAPKQMVDLAAEFSAKTFSYDQATDLVTYLESDVTGDNTNLGRVNIHSSFSQITWAGLTMEPAGEVFVTLNELNGSASQVTVEYLAIRHGLEGQTEYYEVEDNFTMRMGEQRVYMMDFDRRAEQIFMGTHDVFNGSRILLGITEDDQVHGKNSESGNVHAFISNRDLWSFDEKNEENQAVRVFSFRSSSEEGIRPSFDRHSIKILQVTDEGDIDFLVYGYIGRGRHEGCVGVMLYHYDVEENALAERFFIPASCGDEELALDLQELSYLSPGGILYIKVNAGIYAIDLNSNESMVVAEGLPEGGYAISPNGQRLAWQEGTQLYQSNTIHLMNLETGEKNDITTDNGDCLRVLGFVGNDFIYGIARENTQWMINGRLEELPMYALEILGSDMEIQTRYEKPGYFICGVSVRDSRIHLNRIISIAGDVYQAVDEDTIVCNEEIVDNQREGIGWYADKERQKLYFVQLNSEIGKGRIIRAAAPEKITYDTSEILNLGTTMTAPGIRFYAYGGGHLLGITQEFSKAVSMAYDKMGVVVCERRQTVWNRVDRPGSSTVNHQIEAASRFANYAGEFTGNRLYADGTLVLDARGCSLNQVLYFLGKGHPVLAYREGGTYCFLMGYDQYNVTLFYPETGESEKMGLNDAGEYFSMLGNDFLCGIFAGGE